MNKPLILVVEDDPPVRNLITTTLKTNDYLTKPFSVEELLARFRVTQRRLSYMTAEMLAERCCVSAGVYGNPQEKAGAGAEFPPVYPDPYRRGVPDDEGGMIIVFDIDYVICIKLEIEVQAVMC